MNATPDWLADSYLLLIAGIALFVLGAFSMWLRFKEELYMSGPRNWETIMQPFFLRQRRQSQRDFHDDADKEE